MQVKRLDNDGRGSWKELFDMIRILCRERVDVGFDYRDMKGWKLPCVDFRLDDPAEVDPPDVTRIDGQSVERWQYGTVVFGQSVPAGLNAEQVWLLQPNSATATAYRMFHKTALLLRKLSLPAEFLWSSVPLAPLCDQMPLLLQRERLCWAQGAIHTVWLRCEQDDVVQTSMQRIGGCGELRVQNMTTANTWIKGELQEAALMDALLRGSYP